ncbi:GRIP domain containing protein, partial [Aphelenchoides avenae]
MAASAYNNDPALLQQLEEQKGRLELYEKKLKDVVKAYKSIDQEKKALETALSAMSGDAAAAGSAPAPSGAASTSSESQAGSDVEPSNQADALKQAITTLTVENKKREIALQNDRRALL